MDYLKILETWFIPASFFLLLLGYFLVSRHFTSLDDEPRGKIVFPPLTEEILNKKNKFNPGI